MKYSYRVKKRRFWNFSMPKTTTNVFKVKLKHADRNGRKDRKIIPMFRKGLGIMARPFSVPSFTKILILLAVIFFLSTMCTYGMCGSFYPTIEDFLVTAGPKILIITFLFVFVKLITSTIKIITAKGDEGSEEFKFTSILRFARYALWVVFVIISANLIFGDIGAILTSLGLIGFGVTFALQKPILNFVGWMSINVHKTFKVGDRIRIGEYKGDVVEIKMMHTIIKSLLDGTDHYSGKLVSIPNEMHLVNPVENFTKDNNFIKTELKIGITYESDWRRAKKIFENIVNEITKRNNHKFRSNLNRQISVIDSTIKKLSKRFERAKAKKREHKLREQIMVLEVEKKNIQETFVDIPEQFRPTIHVDMEDSSIVLSALFMAPYNMIRTIRTEINSAFLDAVRKDKFVEIAYPHLHLVTKSQPTFDERKLSSFTEDRMRRAE